MPKRTCTYGDCTAEHYGRGWCAYHWDRWYHYGSPDPPQTPQRIDRFWARVDIGSPDECWLWTGSRHPSGSGKVRWGRKHHSAHRVAWLLTFGPIPVGEGYHGTCVLHRCDNPPCCNPAHLWLGTQAENVADMWAKGRGRY